MASACNLLNHPHLPHDLAAGVLDGQAGEGAHRHGLQRGSTRRLMGRTTGNRELPAWTTQEALSERLACCTIENVAEIKACDAIIAASVAKMTIGHMTDLGVEFQYAEDAAAGLRARSAPASV